VRQVDGITALSLARKAHLGRFSKNRAKPSAKANGKSDMKVFLYLTIHWFQYAEIM